MSELSKEEKLAKTLELIKKYGITPYELGSKLTISTYGARQIVKGVTKNPNEKTLDEILNYIHQRYINKKPYKFEKTITENIVQENSANYQKKVLSAIENLNQAIRRDNDAFADALRITLLNTEDIKEDVDLIKSKGNQITSSIEKLILTIKGNKFRA